jgi:transcriptional regulator with XRE-family HTH domain
LVARAANPSVIDEYNPARNRHRVANRINTLGEASRVAAWQLMEIGREVRLARIASGKRQSDVARMLRCSTSHVSRIERAQVPTVGYGLLSRLAAAVGLRLSLRAYPTGRRLMDKPQLALLGRLRSSASSSLRWQTEVSVPIPGDLRAADAVATIDGCSIVVEALTRLSDFQAQSRAAILKKRDLGATRLILAIAGTSANRRALRGARDVLDASFPLGTKAILASLREAKDPGADGVAVL